VKGVGGVDLIGSERQVYEQMWGWPAYAANSPGETLAPMFLEIAGRLGFAPGDSVLDAGCGSGKGGLALAQAGARVTLCDLTPAGLVPEAAPLAFHDVVLWQDLLAATGRSRPFEFVYCCDVLEHIPTPFVMLVIHRLLQAARQAVFLSISLVPDQFGVLAGKPLHQTVQSFTQWRDQLACLGDVVEARDLLINGVYMVKPR
jgi:2-polyprenyl-3-methyl-5-hydroxy-6-metoxy-1,4-benzoquinol methylase